MEKTKTIIPKKGLRITQFVIGLVIGIFILSKGSELNQAMEFAEGLGAMAVAFGGADDSDMNKIKNMSSAIDIALIGAICLIVGSSLGFRSIKGGWIVLCIGTLMLLISGALGWQDCFIFTAGGVVATIFCFIARKSLLINTTT
tara:strand:- start:594 stop:1025 length:432 start_codon:yes stop_codon:yes gene_type:complete